MPKRIGYFSSLRRIEDQKRALGNESGTPETRAPSGRRARGTVAPALVFTLPPAEWGSSFLRRTYFHWREHIFTRGRMQGFINCLHLRMEELP